MNKKHIVYSILVLIIAVFSACTGKKEKASALELLDSAQVANIPSMVGDNVNTLVSDSGLLKYRMQAEKVFIYDKVDSPYWNFPEGIHIITYSNVGKSEGDIKSKYAKFYVEKKLWELRKDVVAVSPEGKVLKTERLFWDQEKKTIFSDTLSSVIQGEIVTTGTSFTSDETFDDWHVDNPRQTFIEEE